MGRSGAAPAQGFALLELLVVLLIIALLIGLVVPNFVQMNERSRRASVRSNMHVVQTALEAYASDNLGRYPDKTLSWWAHDSCAGIAPWFPGGDPFGARGAPVRGSFPVNPYSGRPYNSGSRESLDLDYKTFFGQLQPGENARRYGSDTACPYFRFGNVPPFPGGIGIATCLALDRGVRAATEYGIYAFGRETDFPMHEISPSHRPAPGDTVVPGRHWVFTVLYN